ncbi:MAG: YxeA family protein [Streptococcaceae bacterium]|jgi:uncharacterized protein (TIGR01655 family)|nr:YxeA family protein [Streptococcaceae bacterium]
MKKIFMVVALGAIIAGTIFGWKYYQETYAGATYYTVVPKGIEKKEILSDSGEKMGQGVEYNLKAFNDKQESKEISFSIITEGKSKQGEPYQPGTYLKVEASQKRVISQEVIKQKDVPAKVLAYLN